jgi:predicted dehydrogenase
LSNVRIGVIGAGHLGRIHARLLASAEGVELVGVADPLTEARRAVAAEYQIAEAADFRDLIPRIDAAIVATPTRFHHPVAMHLAERGIHLLVEKPITTTAAEARELLDAARQNHVVLQVGHIERFNPALVPLLPRLTRPRYIEAVRQGPYTFRSTDVSVVLDLMIHDIDLALWLAGCGAGNPVSNISAVGWTVMGGDEDFAQARLEFTDGCVANLTSSRVSHRPRRQMQVWTADAQLEIDFNTRRAAIVENLAGGPPPVAPPPALITGQAPPPDRRFESLMPLREIDAPPQNAMVEEHRDFLECIRTGREPRVNGEAGLLALETARRILDAIAHHEQSPRSDSRPSHGDSPTPTILRGPHWDHLPKGPLRRKEAG